MPGLEGYGNLGRNEIIWSELQKLNPNVTNSFENYQTPFDYNAMKTELDKYYSGKSSALSSQIGSNVMDARRAAAARNAMSGIKGSAAESAINSSTSPIIDSGYNALNALSTQEASQLPQLMNLENTNKFNVTKAATDINQQNFSNYLNSLMSMAGFNKQWEAQNQAEDSQPGFLSDLMSGIGGIAKIASIPTGASSFLGSDIFSGIFGKKQTGN